MKNYQEIFCTALDKTQMLLKSYATFTQMNASKRRKNRNQRARKPHRFSITAYLKKVAAEKRLRDLQFDLSPRISALDFGAEVHDPHRLTMDCSVGCGKSSVQVDIIQPPQHGRFAIFDTGLVKAVLERGQILDAELKLLQIVSEFEENELIIKKIERRRRSLLSRKQELYTAAKSQKVGSKGTEQSHSRNGSQAIRTWVPATFESDLNVTHFLALNTLLNHRISNVGNGALQSSSVIRGVRPTRRASRSPQPTLAHLQ